jgi:hypothetical protein
VKVDPRLIEQLAARLKQAVHDTRHIETAQIQIVGLDAVKRRAGAMWPELAARVRQTSHDFIKKRAGAHDLVIAAGDGFLVVYAEPDGAEEKCLRMQGDLNAFYLGELATRELSAEVRHESLAAAQLIERLEVVAPMSVAPPPGPRPEMSASHHLPPVALEIEAPVPLSEVPLAILPVWSAAQQAVTGYWIAPEWPDRRVARRAYDPDWSEAGWRHDEKDFLELDLRILSRALTEIATGLKEGRKCLVGYSVHASTMMNRNLRRLFLQALMAAPPATRPLLLGRVAEAPPGTPMATFAEWVHQLRAVSPRVAIEIHPGQRNVTGMEELGIFSVACVLPTAHPAAAESAALARMIGVWSRDLKRQNLKLRLDNVDDPRLLSLALDGQIDFCSSPRLWPATATVEGMRPYSHDRFLRALPQAPAERRSA